MLSDNKICHGQFDYLHSCSTPMPIGTISKKLWRLRNVPAHTAWHLKYNGPVKTLELTWFKAIKLIGINIKDNPPYPPRTDFRPYEEVLNLKPGELAEVKSEAEIYATLDGNRKNKGLLWMTGMRKFCGKKYRVYKRLERILLESNGEFRKLKNTVLLEGVICDGKEFNGCDRSCFHYWREAWLRRVE